MNTPIERFKDSYQNHRWNPFTDADMAIDKEEAHLTIPSSSPFCLQLLEIPRKDTPSSVSVYCHSDGLAFTEVVISPTQGQFRVDYPDPDGEGTGMIEFHSTDNGKDITVNYKATGSPIIAEILDTKLSHPAGSPAENQVVILKSGAPTWAYNPIRMFHAGEVIYNAGGEDESCLLFDFEKGVNESKAYLRLKGAKLFQGLYSEIGEHLHAIAAGSTGTVGPHQHMGLAHNHAFGSLVGSQPAHLHHYIAGEVPDQHTSTAGGDEVTISGSTANGGSGNTMAAGDHSHSIAAKDTANYSPTVKTYPDSLKVYIDGVDKTANILALSGLAKLGDGTNTHGFVAMGTGKLDITSLLGAGPWHTIKITEPTANKGGRCLLNLELV